MLALILRSRSLSRGMDTGVRETIEQQQERHEETVREDKNNQCGGEVLPEWAVHQLEYNDQILNRICSKIGMYENWRREAGGGFFTIQGETFGG